MAAHKLDGDALIACLKRAGTRGMNDEDLHPLRAGFKRQNCPFVVPYQA